MDFKHLRSAISQFAGLGENTPSDFSYSSLGEFRKKVDQSAQRSYIEDGFIGNIRPRQAEILMQEPDMTILIKKRMFSSLVENFKPELMDANEKHFYRASKKLFENKCKAIAAYEQLTKIDRVVATTGMLNHFMFPLVMSAFDTLNDFGVKIDDQTKAVLDTLRKVKAFSDVNYRTTWIRESELPALNDLGDGTGVIELTSVSQMNCTISTKFGVGKANFTVEDPYKLMIITNDDIDRAIKQTSGGFLNNVFFRFTEEQLAKSIEDQRTQLSSLRSARGAAGIKFLITEDSILFRKVRAIIDEEGRELKFTVNSKFLDFTTDSAVDLDQTSFEGTNGLQGDEIGLFKQILKNIYLLMGLKKTTTTTNFQFNKNTNYVRRKMRLHFGNKPIIQPMDVVHIFLSSKTKIDSKSAGAISNAFMGGQITNAINDTIGSIQNNLDSIAASFNGNGDVAANYAVTEKNAIAGPEFPMWLWNVIRNDFTRQAAGTHVFAGIVQNPTHTYSGGKYTLQVTASDNTHYFSIGQLNINPSVEVFNSALYDPLTPRQLDIDEATGFIATEGEPPLLPENIKLLNSNLVKFKNGRFRGYPANDEIYNSFDIEKVKNSSNRYSFRRKYEDPDGFVYRWKEGVQSLTYMGEPHPSGELPGDSSPNMRSDPFSGQDVMNVLSLLITGIPYNYNTFMKAAIESGALSRDDLLNESQAKSYFRGLISDISKNNATWGNFVPFKKLIINEAGNRFIRNGQFDLLTKNNSLALLLRQRAEKFDQLVKSSHYFANNPQFLNVDANGNLVRSANAIAGVSNTGASDSIIDTTAASGLAVDIIQLDFEIAKLKQSFENSIKDVSVNTKEGMIKIYGDDISFDPNVSDGGNSVTHAAILREREEFRKRINYLTQRRLWKVKANEDQNLFIVDDSYDKNYDIQAFEQGIAGQLELLKSSYTNSGDKIRMVGEQLLQLEVFADTQGHIQARPPQYNRVPSSVFYKMIETKDITGIQLFPSYLETLFTDQVKGLAEKIEIVEDQIRLRTAVLGYVTDDASVSFLKGTQGGFAFVTDQINGRLGGKDIRLFTNQANSDLTDDQTPKDLKAIANVQDNLNKVNNILQAAQKVNTSFDIIQRITLINETSFVSNTTDSEKNLRFNQINDRLKIKTGLPVQAITDFISSTKEVSQVEVLNVTEQIAQLISERQSVLKQLSNAIKNLGDGLELNNSAESGRTALLPFLNKKKSVPEILEHMIEDEDVDDFGPNSGKRYVIKDNQILSLTINENNPELTAVEVTGFFDPLLKDPPGGFDTGEGNPICTAWAVDFDMWRMYGLRTSTGIQAPYLNNPDTQLAPFAVGILNKARKSIFKGSLEIVGNEFMQPGEVYYIEDRDLLFYAESISHSFSYGGTFTTSVELTYGHNPGEYIPTILDLVGKGLYATKNQADLLRHNRHGNSNGDVYISSVVFDVSQTGADPVSALVSGSYGNANRKALGNLLLASSGALSQNSLGQKAKIELRIYYDGSADSNLRRTANAIINWLSNPTKANISGGSLLPDNSVGKGKINTDDVGIVLVDTRDVEETRSPSSGAMNKAREVTSSSGHLVSEADSNDVNSDIDRIKTTLFTQIIDIWITFVEDKPTTELDKNNPNPQSETAQLNLQKSIQSLLIKK